ncbi:MAG: dTDP-4-dehydrorhamnose reductase [Deltaproteobacteria bacterium RBG_13_52_11]|nr:MAG: dTDP-4-dehydrorhamnose reductase [Deltaproteobacteria bacterium RBG_13_52_11]
MKKVLIIGALGMLGHDLLRIFAKGYDVIGLDKENVDITRQGATRKAIKEISPAVVINAAGYTDVDGCEKKMHKAFVINAEGSKNVAKGCRDNGAKLVYISTDYIFDGEKGSPYREDDPANPLNIYGESKLMGERYIEELLDDFLIVRTQWLYGKHGRNFVETILALAAERDIIEVVHDQRGSPTYTTDLSKAIAALVRKDLKGTFHVSNSGSCSWYDFAFEIVRLAGASGVEIVPVSSSSLNRAAKRPLYSVFNRQRLEQEAGIKMRPWQEALQDYFYSRGR